MDPRRRPSLVRVGRSSAVPRRKTLLVHGIAQAATWAATLVGVVMLATGAVTLLRRELAMTWLRNRLQWKREGWAQVMFGLFVMVEAIPRLAHGSAELVFGFSIAALAPLGGAIGLRMRAGRV